jgi:hypothetical protein
MLIQAKYAHVRAIVGGAHNMNVEICNRKKGHGRSGKSRNLGLPVHATVR